MLAAAAGGRLETSRPTPASTAGCSSAGAAAAPAGGKSALRAGPMPWPCWRVPCASSRPKAGTGAGPGNWGGTCSTSSNTTAKRSRPHGNCWVKKRKPRTARRGGLSFEEVVVALSRFWAGQGCVIQQPYDLEVGAGTMHPETFFRVLGPLPNPLAYLPPNRPPADRPFRDNPNRLYKHIQFQVILKPAPADV